LALRWFRKKLVKKNYDVWAPLWKELGPELTQQVTQENYIRRFDQSRKNTRAWEQAHSEKIE
jgi:hypothetical protein